MFYILNILFLVGFFIATSLDRLVSIKFYTVIAGDVACLGDDKVSGIVMRSLLSPRVIGSSVKKFAKCSSSLRIFAWF